MPNNYQLYQQDQHNNNDCEKKEPKEELRLATAYIPNQPYVGILPLEEGFQRGSMFPNLYEPYVNPYN